MHRYSNAVVLLILTFFTSIGLHAQTKLYVNATGGSDLNTGSSWTTAYRSLGAALANAKSSTDAEIDIWVSSGAYTPVDGLPIILAGTVDNDTAFTFYRGNGIGKSLKVFGGFAGTEDSLARRDGLHQTYIAATDFYSTHTTFHVGIITGLAPSADSVVLDGLIFSSAHTTDTANKYYNGVRVSNAYGGGLVISNDSTKKIAVRNCTIEDNSVVCFTGNVYGGGISLVNASLDIENCTVANNSAIGSFISFGTTVSGNAYGGGIYALNSSLNVLNCTFSGNSVRSGIESSIYTSFTGQGGGIYLNNDSCKFTGCTFNNNNAAGYRSTGSGGAIFVTGCTPLFVNCSFNGNEALGGYTTDQGAGGAVYSSYAGTTYTNCSFTGNIAQGAFAYTTGGNGNGGAIANYSAPMTITSSSFTNNKAKGGSLSYGSGSGGAIFNAGSTLLLSKTAFLADSANGSGGIGGAISSGGYPLLIDSCSFRSCIAGNKGGGIYAGDSSLTVTHSIFENGYSNQQGGAIYASSYRFHIMANGNVFVNNTSYEGGALSMLANNTLCTDTLINNVFAQNTANKGGALSLSSYSSFIGNNTFYADSVSGSGCAGGAVYELGVSNNDTLVNNIFYNNYNGSGGNADTGQAGSGIFYFAHTLFSYYSPLFADTANLAGPDGIWQTADDGLQLSQCSPALNGGANLYVPAASVTDVAGQPRIQADVVNLGAYETSMPGSITGSVSVCTGSTITLSDTTGGGMWLSSDTTVAIVDMSGSVTGIGQGSTTITYIYPCGTRLTTHPITVERMTSAIAGADSMCLGSTITLADSAVGGTWNSAGTSVTIVDSTGMATGIAVGTNIISYTITNACGASYASLVIDVQGTATAIIGLDSVCLGDEILVTDSIPGGVWSVGDTSIAIINNIGAAHGVAQGTTVVTYALNNACGSSSVIKTLAIDIPASVITGDTALCTGNTVLLADSAIGGTWSTYSSAVLVSVSGLVSGITAGSAIITYSVTNACGSSSNTQTIIVDRPASTIIGAFSLCTGDTTVLTDSATGGVWASDAPLVATIGSNGVVEGIAQGLSVITYMVSNNCGVTTAADTILVQRTASPVTAPDSICLGMSATFTDSTSGGTWSSDNTTIATVSATGIVTGISAGYTAISYNIDNACGASLATFNVGIGAPARPIKGEDTVCIGNTVLLTDSTYGGMWSSDTSVAVIVGGTVTPVSPGITDISYSIANVCGITTSHLTLLVLSMGACDSATAIPFISTPNMINIYPNPVNGILYIDAPMAVRLRLTGSDGRLIINGQVNHAVDMTYLPGGSYILMIYDENKNLLKTENIILIR